MTRRWPPHIEFSDTLANSSYNSTTEVVAVTFDVRPRYAATMFVFGQARVQHDAGGSGTLVSRCVVQVNGSPAGTPYMVGWPLAPTDLASLYYGGVASLAKDTNYTVDLVLRLLSGSSTHNILVAGLLVATMRQDGITWSP